MKTSLSRFDRFELFILGTSFLTGVIFSFLPQNSVLSWFTTDDAFYYFVTAKNISLGLGSTFDGIALTNGYHPLWLLICVPIFALTRVNLYLPLRLIILLQYALIGISGILLYRLMRKRVSVYAAYFTVTLWLFLPALHLNIMIGGVESTLNGLMIVAVLTAIDWARGTDAGTPDLNRRLFILGLLSGLTVLARLDNVFFIAFVGLWLFFRLALPSLTRRGLLRDFVVRFKPLLLFAAPILVLVGAYLFWNQLVFGSIMPISGAVKHWWGIISGDPYGTPPGSLQQLYLETFASTNHNQVPFWLLYSFGQSIATPLNRTLTAIGLPALVKTVGILAVVGAIALLDSAFAMRAINGLSMIPLLLGALAQVAYYKLGGGVASRYWYWVQEDLLFVLFVGVIVGVLLHLLARHRRGKFIVKFTLALSIFAILFSNINYLRRNYLTRDSSKPDYLQYTEFLEHNTERGAIIGIVASGSTAYFIRERTIVNLDGLINGYEYFRALQSDRAVDYLKEIGVDYLFGSKKILLESPPYTSNLAGKITPVDTEDRTINSMILWRMID
jgi:hypothetical protein